MKKLNASSIAGVILALLAVACGPRKTAVQTPSAQEFAEYVKSYTGGIVADDAVIRIDLAQEPVQQPAEGLFSIQPPVKGTTQWATPTTVTFTPESLKAGETYTVSFALDKVLPEAPSPFTFSLAVRGKAEETAAEEEPDNGQTFRVTQALLKENLVE